MRKIRISVQNKSGKVQAISGQPLGRDVILDEDMEIVAELQDRAWRAAGLAQRAADQIRIRIEGGATIKARRFVWDGDLSEVFRRRLPAVKRSMQGGS